VNPTTQPQSPLAIGLAFCAGLGLTIMVVALALGVINGAEANANGLGVLFAAGLVMLIGGIGGWLGAVQPFQNFDDISKPAEDDHHASEPHADEHTIVEHKAH
jgi:ABC-type nickel/cobalt efflux system permease component RcnA